MMCRRCCGFKLLGIISLLLHNVQTALLHIVQACGEPSDADSRYLGDAPPLPLLLLLPTVQRLTAGDC